MLEYESLRIIWWLLLGALLIGFAITDGFDLGVGMLYRFLSRSDAERRVFLETIEPVWEGNQVWFILGGGAIFAAWPALYAASFSGFYVAMFLLLVALILRPVGFNFRNKVRDLRWRNVWDWALFTGSFVPALVFGVAIGNLFLGVPFHFDNELRAYYTGGFFGLLRPFPVLIGLTSVAMLAMHGATYAHLKAGSPMAERAATAGRWAAVALTVLVALAGLWLAGGVEGYSITSTINTTAASNPLAKTVALDNAGWLDNYATYPAMMIAPVAAVLLPLVVVWALRRGAVGGAFIVSALSVASVITTAGMALFPFLLPSSTEPSMSLTVWDASSSQRTLFIMFVATVLFLPVVLIYTSWVFRVLKGRVTLEEIRHSDSAY